MRPHAVTPFGKHIRDMLLSSWLNIHLVFFPAGALAYMPELNPLLLFSFNALAIVPLSLCLLC